MINPIKIKVKGFPKDLDNFYNENDLMSKIKIIITDFPIITSVITNYYLTEFHSYGKAKMNILQKESNPLVVKNEFDFNIKETKVLLKGKANSGILFESKSTASILQKGRVEETKSISFYIIPDKCYVIGSKSRLGDWDGSTLESIDNSTLSYLAGKLD